MKPPVPYFGGKMTVGPAIAALLPPHEHYVEPYCGSLAVLLAKPASRMETVNDLDRELVTFWSVLRSMPGELARVCALTPHSRAEHAATYEPCPDESDLETARRVFIQLTQGRAGQLRRTGWRHYVNPSGSSASMPDYLAGYVDRIAAAAARLQHVSLECLPALDLVAKYGREPNVLLYVDPPYLASVRGLERDRGRYDRYRCDMPSEAEHRELAEALHAARAAVVLSGYPSDLYDRELYAGWDRHTIPAGTGQGGTWANRTEVLWSNRPLGVQPALAGLELPEVAGA
jgi:DNA adenine methylase